MSIRNSRIDPVTGSRQLPVLQLLFGALGLFGILAYLAANFPSYSSGPAILAVVLGTMGVVVMIWMNYRPNLWAKAAGYILIGSLLALVAVRSFGYLLPDAMWLTTTLIVATCCLSYFLPMLNVSATAFLRQELIAPRTKLGRNLFRAALLLAPVAGLIAGLVGLYGGRAGNAFPIAIFVGPLAWMLAVALPFGSAYPIYPLEKDIKTPSMH